MCICFGQMVKMSFIQEKDTKINKLCYVFLFIIVCLIGSSYLSLVCLAWQILFSIIYFLFCNNFCLGDEEFQQWCGGGGGFQINNKAKNTLSCLPETKYDFCLKGVFRKEIYLKGQRVKRKTNDK